MVDAALDRDAPLTDVLLGPGAQRSFAPLVERIGARGIRVHELKEGVLERLGSTSTPQPVLAVASRAQPDVATLGGDGLVLVAVGLADPGNAGTMLRSAEAAGAAAIVLCRGSVDAYNPKVVRASAGAIFGIPVFEEWTAVEALDALGGLGRARLAARAHGGPRYDTLDFRAPTALVLGNEAHGLDPALDAHLDGTVSIPMAAPAESLNVAMAATVVCFEAARQRRAGGRP